MVAKRYPLSDRHRRILALRQQGKATRQIAEEVGVSQLTVIRALGSAESNDSVEIPAKIAAGMDAAHALIVRPNCGGYEIISGHHRWFAAQQAGLEKLPCWVREMSNEDAYMQLVLCNTQSELHPLEEGKHAAESGMDLKAYAERAGKAQTTLRNKLMAWRVGSESHMGFEHLRDCWRNLAEIHASPKWLWSALVSRMVADGWTVETTRKQVSAMRDFPEALPPWMDTAAVAEGLVSGALKIGDIARMERLQN